MGNLVNNQHANALSIQQPTQHLPKYRSSTDEYKQKTYMFACR